MGLSRRHLLGGALIGSATVLGSAVLGPGLIGLTRKSRRKITGSFVNNDHVMGHRIRDREDFRAPRQAIKVPLVIVGGGVAGLSAAWRLEGRGFRDFLLLESAQEAGGNSRWGENEITSYPWGAHNVPVPNDHSADVRELFEELGLIRDGGWNEAHLCAPRRERAFRDGRWYDGLEFEDLWSARDRDQFDRFSDMMEDFRSSGEFTIPMSLGARPSPLDRLSMAEWLRENGFDSAFLTTSVGKSCEDDYGSLAADTSAWAGIHYFASRERDDEGPFVWPEGNGWIVKRLLAKLGRFVRTGAMVYRIEEQGGKFQVLTEGVEYSAEVVIFAAPSFLASYLMEDAPRVDRFEYSPWLTANLTLDRRPRELGGVGPAWDNVIDGSPSQGYVVATHQTHAGLPERCVLTYYLPLARGAPARNRKLLLERGWNRWVESILSDLERAHPDIRDCVAHIDIMRLGHAMVRPYVGFLGSEQRLHLAEHPGRILFANSDLSGFSLFEEAQDRGVAAAEQALAILGGGS